MNDENETDPRNPDVIARTIVQQLCGRAEVLRIMLGVTTVGVLPSNHPMGLGGNVLKYALEGGIVFAFEQVGDCAYNTCQIGLTGMDDYTVEFGKVVDGVLDIESVLTCETIYADMLKDVFEQSTGMVLDVPKIVFID